MLVTTTERHAIVILANHVARKATRSGAHQFSNRDIFGLAKTFGPDVVCTPRYLSAFPARQPPAGFRTLLMKAAENLS